MRAHLVLSLLLVPGLLLGLPLTGCDSTGPTGKPDGGGQDGSSTPSTCDTDDDCEDDPLLRACKNHQCVDAHCPDGMTYVAAGTFSQGCDSTEKDCKADSQPSHDTTLSHAFCISRTELTVSQFRQCVAAGHCQAPADLLCSQRTATWTPQPGPNEQSAVNCLLFDDAMAACSHFAGRLPTEAEWEKAARGRDGRRYPWKGNSMPADCQHGVNWGGSGCAGRPWTVGSGKGVFAESASFASDMAGNVWEWTADWYGMTSYADCKDPCTDPTGPATGTVRVRRGGGFSSTVTQELRVTNRDFQYPSVVRSDSLGVRCAAPAPTP